MDGSLSSFSSGAGVAPQYCGTSNTNYYCPADGICKSRSQRCTNNEVCDYGGNANDRCFMTTSGAYTVQLGHANLFGSSSLKRSTMYEHRFIQYRGFTYEFGKGYGVQILDVNDPDYKYRNNQNINSGGINNAGNGYCTWEAATMFTQMWKKEDYQLDSNNCQHFADALKKLLTTGSCAQQQSLKKREDRMNQLQQEIDAILTDCNVICCYNDAQTSNANSLSRDTSKIASMFVAFTCIMYMI